MDTPNVDFFAHPTAVIDPGCQIGNGSRIWHFCHVSGRAVIGSGCSLGQNVFVADGARIGDRVKIQNNVSVYTGVEIEDDVFLGPSAVLTNVINPRSSVERKSEYRFTRIRRGATVGANATIVCGTELGEWCFVAAGAVVTRDVRPHSLVMGAPARHTGWMSKRGHKLVFDEKGRANCPEGGETYFLKDGAVRCETT